MRGETLREGIGGGAAASQATTAKMTSIDVVICRAISCVERDNSAASQGANDGEEWHHEGKVIDWCGKEACWRDGNRTCRSFRTWGGRPYSHITGFCCRCTHAQLRDGV